LVKLYAVEVITNSEAVSVRAPEPFRATKPRRLGCEPINLVGGWIARVRYAPIATKLRIATKRRDVHKADL